MSIDNLFPRNLSGVYRYNSVQDFIDNKPATFAQGFGEGGGLTSWDQNTYALYVSDSFRVGTHLTFDAGVRYDWQTIPEPATNAFPQHPEFISQIEEDKDNYAPRPTDPNRLASADFAKLARVGTDIVTIGPNYEAQEAWRSSVQFEQQIGATYSAGIGVIYQKTEKVQGTRNINLVPLAFSFGNLPVYTINSPNRRYTDM